MKKSFGYLLFSAVIIVSGSYFFINAESDRSRDSISEMKKVSTIIPSVEIEVDQLKTARQPPMEHADQVLDKDQIMSYLEINEAEKTSSDNERGVKFTPPKLSLPIQRQITVTSEYHTRAAEVLNAVNNGERELPVQVSQAPAEYGGPDLNKYGLRPKSEFNLNTPLSTDDVEPYAQ